MWGNRQGWIVSAVIVGLMGWMLWTLAQVPEPPRISGRFPNLLKPIALPVQPETLLPPRDVDGDAGDKYIEAIGLYEQDKRKYDRFYKKFDVDAISELKAVELLVDAVPMRRMTLLSRTPKSAINYTGDTGHLDAIVRVGDIADALSAYYRGPGKDPAKAQRYSEAVFALGTNLFNERVIYQELSAGSSLMSKGAQGLKMLAEREGETERATKLDAFELERRDYVLKNVQALWNVVAGMDVVEGVSAKGNPVSLHAGDVLALAKSREADRMWRVEALLKLGRMKFNAARRGDQIAATRELPKWVGDDDKLIRTAAEAAHNLTIDEYRMMR